MPQPGQVSLQQDRSVLQGKGFTCSLGFFGVPGSTWRNTAVLPPSCLGETQRAWLYGEPELRGAGLKPINTWGISREGNYLCPPKNNVGTRTSGQKPAGINSGWKCEGFHPVQEN